jgi:RTA1 like protein
MEIVGYIFRCLSSKLDPYYVLYFVLQYFFIVVAPVFFSAAIYTVLSVLINRLGRQYAPLSPRLILWGFVCCDIVATVVQIAGAALIGVAESKRKSPDTANHILLGGLAFQVFSFAVFIILTVWILYRARASIGGRREKYEGGVIAPLIGMDFIIALLVATVMVYLRTCFRLTETAYGVKQKLSSHEVYFGCLEFTPVVVAVFVLNVWHPGMCISKQ